MTTSPISDFYTPWLSADALSSFDADCFLQEGENPIIYYTTAIDSEFNYLKSLGYSCIGDSGFNGISKNQDELEAELRNIAKTYGARVVIYDQNYTNTISNIYSTSYGIYSSNTKRYDYNVYYFVYTPDDVFKTNPLGFLPSELSQRQKEKFKRNTGLIITTVWNKTPAFYANLALNDIVIGINDIEIIDYDSYLRALNQMDFNSPIQVYFIRNGIQQSTTLVL